MSRLSKMCVVKQQHTYHCQEMHNTLMPEEVNSMCRIQGYLPCTRCALGATYTQRNNFLYLTDTLGEPDETADQEPD
ncbi:hypothetical protein VPHD292_0085 [Vibrio phage D292]